MSETATATETVADAPVETGANTSIASIATGEQPAAQEQAAPAEGDGTGTAATEQAPATPEKYEFTAPEGFEIDQDSLAGYENLARDAGLSQEQFAKVTEYGLKYFQDQLSKQADAQVLRSNGWRNEILNDRDIADQKGLLPEARASVARVIDQFGGDDLRRALDDTGAGNHPAVVRAFINLGKAMGAADSLDLGKPPQETRRDRSFDGIAARMYGKGA